MEIRPQISNVLTDFVKSDNFDGRDNPNNENQKNHRIKSLDHLQLGTFKLVDSLGHCVNAKIFYFSKGMIFSIFTNTVFAEMLTCQNFP